MSGPPPGLTHVRQVQRLSRFSIRWWWGGRDVIGMDFRPGCRLYGLAVGLRFFGVVVCERKSP